jgi:hypothetical protein
LELKTCRVEVILYSWKIKNIIIIKCFQRTVKTRKYCNFEVDLSQASLNSDFGQYH